MLPGKCHQKGNEKGRKGKERETGGWGKKRGHEKGELAPVVQPGINAPEHPVTLAKLFTFVVEIIAGVDVELGPKADIVDIDESTWRSLAYYQRPVDARWRLYAAWRPPAALAVFDLVVIASVGWRHLIVVPLAVVVEGVEDVLTVRVDQVDPGLPQRMHDVVDETHLHRDRT